jgi:hypothetical protein
MTKAILAALLSLATILVVQIGSYTVATLLGFYTPLLGFVMILIWTLIGSLIVYKIFLRLLQFPNLEQEYSLFMQRRNNPEWRMQGNQASLLIGAIVCMMSIFMTSAFVAFVTTHLDEEYELQNYGKKGFALVQSKYEQQNRGKRQYMQLRYVCQGEKQAQVEVTPSLYERVNIGDTVAIIYSSRSCEVLKTED